MSIDNVVHIIWFFYNFFFFFFGLFHKLQANCFNSKGFVILLKEIDWKQNGLYQSSRRFSHLGLLFPCCRVVKGPLILFFFLFDRAFDFVDYVNGCAINLPTWWIRSNLTQHLKLIVYELTSSGFFFFFFFL